MARKPITDATKAVCYIRASTGKQAISPEVQRAALLKWASGRGIEIIAWFQESDVSGSDAIEDCPELVAAIDYMREKKAGVLAVSKRDRLARDVVKIGMITALVQRSGAVILSAAGEGEGDDPGAQLMRTLIDAFSMYEVQIIRARTKAALAIKASKSERIGSIPFGFRADDNGPRNKRGHLIQIVPCESEQKTIAIVRELREKGFTVKQILAALAELGIPTRKGTPWQHTSIVRILAG